MIKLRPLYMLGKYSTREIYPLLQKNILKVNSLNKYFFNIDAQVEGLEEYNSNTIKGGEIWQLYFLTYMCLIFWVA